MKSLVWFLALCFMYHQIQAIPTNPTVNDIDILTETVASILTGINITDTQSCLNITSTLFSIASMTFDVQKFYANSTATLLLDLDQLIMCPNITCVKDEWQTILDELDDLKPQFVTFEAEFNNYAAIIKANWSSCFGDTVTSHLKSYIELTLDYLTMINRTTITILNALTSD